MGRLLWTVMLYMGLILQVISGIRIKKLLTTSVCSTLISVLEPFEKILERSLPLLFFFFKGGLETSGSFFSSFLASE